jgi:chromosome partitioning protein
MPAIMKTIAIVSQKGARGKTTLALHIATAAEASGLPSAIIDLDPQASAAGWGDSRQGEAPVVVALPYSRLSHGLQAASDGGAELVVIDTAPHSDSVAIAAIKAADLVLIPCRAGILDLRAIVSTAELVASARKEAFVVLNAVPPRATQLLADAQTAIAQHGMDVAPVGLQQRAAFGHALTVGQTASEYEPGGKAAEEVDQVVAWLRQTLNF